jgi:hypothetical protein
MGSSGMDVECVDGHAHVKLRRSRPEVVERRRFHDTGDKSAYPSCRLRGQP